MRSSKITFCLILFILASCGTDLAPSRTDERPQVQCGIPGPYVCQYAPNFTLSDTLGNSVTLSTALTSANGAVIYFTMWCPVCDADMMNMRDAIMPNYPNITFFVVDYVSGSVIQARNAETSNGYAGSRFVVLADTKQYVLNLYNATMGTTVVIDRNGVVKMNEEYKGARLQSVLSGLP